MNDSREEIVRLNIERFEGLIAAESDSDKYRTLDLLLMEARAELEFLVDSRKIAAGLRGKQEEVGDRIGRLIEKAGECRAAAQACGHQSTRAVLFRIAAGYESVVEDVRAAGTSWDRDDADPTRPDRSA